MSFGPADPQLYTHGIYPHCDPRVLHAPGQCEICDQCAGNAQKDRVRRMINFTGETARGLQPCPSDTARGTGGAHVWHGNTPQKPASARDYRAEALAELASRCASDVLMNVPGWGVLLKHRPLNQPEFVCRYYPGISLAKMVDPGDVVGKTSYVQIVLTPVDYVIGYDAANAWLYRYDESTEK